MQQPRQSAIPVILTILGVVASIVPLFYFIPTGYFNLANCILSAISIIIIVSGLYALWRGQTSFLSRRHIWWYVLLIILGICLGLLGSQQYNTKHYVSSGGEPNLFIDISNYGYPLPAVTHNTYPHGLNGRKVNSFGRGPNWEFDWPTMGRNDWYVDLPTTLLNGLFYAYLTLMLIILFSSISYRLRSSQQRKVQMQD